MVMDYPSPPTRPSASTPSPPTRPSASTPFPPAITTRSSFPPCIQVVDDTDVDDAALHALFDQLDEDKNGTIDYGELKRGLLKLNLHPKKMMATPA
jgi:hypothetical protein